MNQLANLPASDNFAAAASGAQASAITGERLRFSKGLYLIGRGDGVQLAAGTQLQAIDVAAAWVKFIDGKVVDQRPGFPMCEREDLDDFDPDEWPAGYDGKPSDPWSNQRYLYLVDPKSGAEYTFVTSSWGGRAAVEQLARQVFVRRGESPGAVALVRLDVGYKKSAKYGNDPAPKFTVVEWSGGDGSVPAERAAPAGRRYELDDEIPF